MACKRSGVRAPPAPLDNALSHKRLRAFLMGLGVGRVAQIAPPNRCRISKAHRFHRTSSFCLSGWTSAGHVITAPIAMVIATTRPIFSLLRFLDGFMLPAASVSTTVLATPVQHSAPRPLRSDLVSYNAKTFAVGRDSVNRYRPPRR